MGKKKDILIYGDKPLWAYHSIIKFLILNLSDKYNFYTDFVSFHLASKARNPLFFFQSLKNKFLYQKLKNNNKYDIVLYLGFYFPKYLKHNVKANHIIKGIYTEGFPPQSISYDKNIHQFINEYFNEDDFIVCGSKNIHNTYKKYFKNIYEANGDIILNLFEKKNKKKANKYFTIGWTGNPRREFKGFYSHIVPAVDTLKEKFKNIKFKTRFSGSINNLNEFYKDIDLVIIASTADAGPSLFMEAALMNIPIISTDVGFASSVIINGKNGFIVERNIEDIVDKASILINDKELYNKMSVNIKNDFNEMYGIAKRKKQWQNLFDSALKKHNKI